MKKRFVHVSLILFLIQSSLVLFGAEAKNFMWRVGNGGNELYLLGSIHAVKQDVYPLDSKIVNAFKKSEVLAVEVDLNKIDASVQMQIVSQSMYKGDEKLKDNLSEDIYSRLVKKMKGYGFAETQVNKMKPWWLVMLMSQFDIMKVGACPDLGIDVYFIKQAKERSMLVKELEGFDFQLKMFMDLSEKMPDGLVNFSLMDSENLTKTFDELVKIWKRGDVEKMNEFFIEMEKDKDAKKVMDVIMHQRNKTMTETVEKYISSGKKHFVVVGAGHLVGKTGIVAQLRKQGYKVEQVKK